MVTSGYQLLPMVTIGILYLPMVTIGSMHIGTFGNQSYYCDTTPLASVGYKCDVILEATCTNIALLFSQNVEVSKSYDKKVKNSSKSLPLTKYNFLCFLL